MSEFSGVVVRQRLLLCVLAFLLSACGGGGSSSNVAPTPSPSVSAWDAVDQAAAAGFAASSGVTGITLSVYNRDDVKVFEKSYGTFSADDRVPVASASKMVSGTVIFRLIDQGLLTLDSTTAAVLGWTGLRGTITLRHLLSFTSGLKPEATCTANPLITLETCVNSIRDDAAALIATPGTRYDYGSVHLQVAARMAEVVAGKSWNAIFDEQLRIPLGLPTDVTYYTAPRNLLGTTNPLPAGGLVISSREYAKVLALSFHRGTYQGVTYASSTLFDTQVVEPYPSVTIGNSPLASIGYPSVHYGLTAWLECATPATGCTTASSPGAFGFTPWFDRANGYYAVLGMYLGSGSGGVVKFSVDLQQQLKPLIVQALIACSRSSCPTP